MHHHTFAPSKYKDYEVCADCGTYHSLALLPAEEVYETYWGDGTGRSTLEQQISNVSCTDECGISKVDRILQFVPKRGMAVLEIACAPGELLRRLYDMNFEVYGIEPSAKYIELIGKHAPGCNIIHGYFPEATKDAEAGKLDCIIGMDIFEHIEDHEGFINEIHRLLIPHGTCVLMSPVILEDGLLRQRDMDFPSEHAWIFTQKFLEPYLKTKFSEVKFARWIVGHELIILRK